MCNHRISVEIECSYNRKHSTSSIIILKYGRWKATRTGTTIVDEILHVMPHTNKVGVITQSSG